MSGWYFAYLILCVTSSAVLTLNGFGLNTWQWWVLYSCTVFSFVCGRRYGEEKR